VTGRKKGGATGDLATRVFGDANLAQYVAWGWRKLEVPVIAAAHGVAFGGGFQILSGADVRFIHPDTRCAIMEMKWGLVPDMAGFPLWRGNARDDVIRELTYTNREFNGREAHAMGFATHVSETPLEDALAWRRSSPTSTRPRCAVLKRSAMRWRSCRTQTSCCWKAPNS
jgi:enoyl-CoA hydratase/carnithine racemase